MAQKIIRLKKAGLLPTIDVGIDTDEHIYFHKDLATHNSYAYSLMGYVQAYLKTYYPIEFWCAALNTIDRGLEKHHQSSLGKYINSISNAGINFQKPDVNKSSIKFESEGNNIYFALSYIKDVSNGAEDIINLRPFKDWEDFLEKMIKPNTLQKERERLYSNEVIIKRANENREGISKELNEKEYKKIWFKNLKKHDDKISVSARGAIKNALSDGIDIRDLESFENYVKNTSRGSFSADIKGAINKRVVKALIFSGAVDFEDGIENRAYKWLLYLAKKKKNKKIKQEIEDYQANMPEAYELVKIEYDYCKYSFTGIDNYIRRSSTKASLKSNIGLVKTISERDKNKKLWVLLGYITDISTKKSKKSGNEYVLITLSDFRDSISVFAFGEDFRKEILGKFKKGQLVKIVVENDSSWLRLPWPSKIGGKFPIEVISG